MSTPSERSSSPLTEQLLQHGIYLREWSPRTVPTYRHSLRDCPDVITKANLNAAVVAMRERRLSPDGINVRLRSINSFLTWLHDEGHLPERLRVKLLKNPPKPIETLSDQDVKRLVTHRPKGRIETRAWVLALLNCGLRISEALGLERADVDLDGLVLKCSATAIRFEQARERIREALSLLVDHADTAKF